MELKAYLDIFWRRKWEILLATLVGLAIATAATLTAEPVYVSSTTLRIATVGSNAIDYARPDINYTERLMNTFASIITSAGARSDIRNQLQLLEKPRIGVEIIPDTELIQIQGEGSTPEIARDVTVAAADMLIGQSQELYAYGGQTTLDILGKQITQIEEELNQARSDYEVLLLGAPDDVVAISAANQSIELKERTYGYLLEQYENARVNEALRANTVLVVYPATTPSQPSKPRHELNIVLGMIVGCFAGIGFAFLRENLDTTLYSVEEIEETTKMVTVGRIPDTDGQDPLVHQKSAFQPHFEAFRRLRTNILALEMELAPQALLVTSAERGEGKSTIAANLAIVMAQSGRRVLLVDCDLRLPTVHDIFRLPNQRGLTDLFLEGVTLDVVLNSTRHQRVQVITSGPLPPNPSELLGSPQMAKLLAQMKRAFDIVILDTPAFLSVTDAAVLVPLVDEVVLVVAQARSRRDSVRAVRQQLGIAHARAVGVVINRSEPDGAGAYAEAFSNSKSRV